MPEVPELRAAVRVSAERRYGRGARNARRLKLAFPLVAMLVIVLVTRADRETGPPAGEVVATVTPSATSTAAPRNAPVIGPPGTDTRASTVQSLASVYGAFRRQVRPSDHPRGVSRLLDQGRRVPKTEFDLANARRLATEGRHAVFGVPTLENGHAGLCIITIRDTRPAGMGCGSFDPTSAYTRPRWSKTFYRPAPLYTLVVPDGTKTVEVHLKSGGVVRKRVQDNAIIIERKGVDRFEWQDADGTERSTRAGI